MIAPQGPGTHDDRRIRALTERLGPARRFHPFSRAHKLRSALGLLGVLLRERPTLVICEGTGLGAGLPLLLARVLRNVPYVISSGDAVGPFFGLRHALLAPFGFVYEALLMRGAAGFIGWTPYLTGRALTLGSPRAMTAPGWSDLDTDDHRRREIREDLGIPQDAVVIGIAGSLTWSPRRRYCYGLELVRAVQSVDRPDVVALIVGDGDGRARLEDEAAGDPRIVFTGRVPHDEVARYLGAMDLASLPQSRDGVGNYRYTIKLAEYAALGIPIVTGRLPFAYDLSELDIVMVPGHAPWDSAYAEGIASVLVDPSRSSGRSSRPSPFNREDQIGRVARFIEDLLQEERTAPLSPSGGDRPAA